ncbi:MAG: hypothetical protein M3Q69_15445 [Acidobacteriota bacterium]|nr:hypothetical protein [Acidobacteriota bacterium]
MRFATLLLTLALASSALAEEVFIPATFRGDGAAGSKWRTEISISNISIHTSLPVETAVTYYPASGQPQSLYVTLTQYETLSMTDALREWFGVESGGGLVRVVWADPKARIGARARIYNVSGNGEFGQGVPSARRDRLVSDVYLHGLSGINGNRTNVGVVNPHSIDAIFWVTLYDSTGISHGSFTISVPAHSYRQLNDIFSHFGTGPLDAAMVRVTGWDTTAYAYASVVRADTGDATYVAPNE